MRIFHYVKGSRYFGIHYSEYAQLDLIRYTTPYWARYGNDMKSTSGFVFMLGSRPIYWSSKKQAALALSSIEAEYRGVVNATIEVVWLHGF